MGQPSVASVLAAAALSLGALAAACSPKVTTDPAATPTAAATPESVAVDTATAEFVAKAALSDMFEIEASKIALERSKIPEVKTFAQQMIDLHTATTAELGTIASAASITPPSALDDAHTSKLNELREAKVEDFDDKYIDQQTEAHENALNAMKGFADGGAPASAIKDFAAKTVPVVQQHLDHVKSLDKSDADDKTKSPT